MIRLIVICSVVFLGGRLVGPATVHADATTKVDLGASADSTLPQVGAEGGNQPLAATSQTEDPALAVAAKAALELIGKRDLEGARELLESLPPTPSRVHAEILLADLLFRAGLTAEARSVLETLAVTSPRRLDVYLAFCELAVRERRWFDGWNLVLLAERLPSDPAWSTEFASRQTLRVRMLKALCAENRRDWKVAMATYELIDAAESTTATLAGLARSSFHLDDHPAAMDYFTKLRAIEPNVQPPLLLMAEMFDGVAKPEEAIAKYREATQTGSLDDRAVARLSLARYLIRENRPAEAKKLLVESQPTAVARREQQFLSALIARMENRLDDAQKVLSQLHREQSGSFVVGNHLALVLAQSEDESLRARALQIAQSNVRSAERNSEAWATLGWIQFQLGDTASAEQSLGNAAQLGPLSRDTLHHLIAVKRAAGDDEAVEMLMSAYETAPGPNFYPE